MKIYKVTSVDKNTKVMSWRTHTRTSSKEYTKEYVTYNIRLDNSLLVGGIYPHSRFPDGKGNREWDSRIESFCRAHNGSMTGLLGKYIAASVDKKGRLATASTDVVNDFKILLDGAGGKSFKTPFPIYDFLKRLNRPLNPDCSISLIGEYSGYNVDPDNLCYQNTIETFLGSYAESFDKADGKAFEFDFPVYDILKRMKLNTNQDNSITLIGKYSEYDVSKRNLCYPNTKKPNTLTLDNIDIIWEHFYCGKKNEASITLKSETSKSYCRGDHAIYISYERYHDRSETRTDVSSWREAILRIGDDLQEEQIQFLREVTDNDAQKGLEYYDDGDTGNDGPNVTGWALTDDEKGAFQGWASGTPLGGWDED